VRISILHCLLESQCNTLIFILCLSKAIGNPLGVTIRNFSVHIFDIRHVSTIQSQRQRYFCLFCHRNNILSHTGFSFGNVPQVFGFSDEFRFQSALSGYIRFVSTHANLTIHIFMNFPIAELFVISCVFKFMY